MSLDFEEVERVFPEVSQSTSSGHLEFTVHCPRFHKKGGKYKIISFYAKRARGLMARYAAVKGITTPEKLKHFDVEGYAWDASVSTETSWVFRRRIAD